MHNLSEGKMEQVIIGVVAIVAIGCATFLGFKKDVDTTTVITSVVTGMFGYAGMAQKSANATATLEVKKDDTKAAATEEKSE